MDYSRSNHQTEGIYAENEKVFFERQMIIFNINKEEFGVDISDVREIIHYTDVTKIPGTEDYIEGIINLRGKIVVIIDLAKKVGLQQTQHDIHTRVIVMEAFGSTLGFIVDNCSEVLRLTGDAMHPPPPIITSRINGEYVQNVGILGARMIIIMDLAKVVRGDEMKHISSLTGNNIKSGDGGNGAISGATSENGSEAIAGYNGKQIMIVEDSMLMRCTLKSFIPRNINILESGDGEQSLEIFKKNAENIGLVLLDIQLPGISGIDVLREILKMKQSVNIVMETSVYDATTKDMCLKMGAKDYLKKPVNKHQIEEVLAKYLL